MYLIGRIVCFFKGHKRGKLVTTMAYETITPDHPLYEGLRPESNMIQSRKVPDDSDGYRKFRCPRCGNMTRYKVKDQNGGTPGDEA